MSKRNVRIAIRDTTDSHNVGFFDNKAGIRYNSANLTQFLKGACSVLVLTYHSKKMIAQSGQKLAFRFKDKDFWLNINSVKKTGYKIELTAYSLSLEANKEKRGPHKPANAMSIKQYIDYYDPEHSFEIGINEVADKSIKLEWSGTDTILARLYSVANSFGAELEFVTELNNDYSLKRHVVNIYREGNLGKDKTGMPVRVGEKLKVINYSDNMDDFYTGIRRTGKDGLTIAGLNKKIYDDKGNLLFYSSGDTLYAPQARDKYPSIARKTNDGYIVNEDSETEHTSKEALFGYMLSELKKHCELKVDYEVEGAVDGSIGDRKTLIDARHFDPPLYVQARISEQTEALLETSNVKTTLSNYVRKSSQIANELLQRVEQLTLEATPYTIKLATNNGIVFKNNQGQSTIYPTLKRGQKPVECTWKWLVDNQGFGTSPTFEVQAAGMSSKLVLTAIALIDGKEVAREQVTFTNVNDGKNGSNGEKGEDGKSLRLFSTQYKYAQSAINTYSADGYTGDWSVVENTTGLKVGDSVQMRVFNTDKESDSWIVASIINVNNDHSIKALSKGVIEKGDRGERGVQGIQGLQGPKGEQGIPGIKGADGRTQYTHLAYADNATGGGFSQTDQNKTYIGVYQDFNATDSPDPTKYRWSKWKGSDGAQGVPGKPGADGKTPYIHFAYAESADGKQGFSTTQTGGKRYIGTYTDYTEADSTDPTKYKWVDMVGTVEVGGRNLLRNSAGPFKPDKKSTNYDNFEYYPKSTIDIVNGKQYILTAETDGMITNNHDGGNASDNVVIWLASPDYKIHRIISDENTDKNGTVFTWVYPTGTYMLRVNTYKKVSDKSIWKIKIAEGNTKTGWSPAPEDVDDNINSKADNALTQEQLNALNEKNSIMQAELEAKASLDMVNQWFEAYQDFVNSNAADKAKSEKDLIAATQRVAKIENNLGDMAQRWNFIDTYMQATNEGLSIGKKDGSSFVRMGDNRISFYSAGKEVAYFSGGALQVDNGVFTKTLQIGRFREEQYHLNPDMNVIRYVGGA